MKLPNSAGGDMIVALPRRIESGGSPRLILPSLHCHIGILWIELDQPRPPPSPLGGDQRRARAAEWIEDDIAALGRIADGTLNQPDRFHRRVQIVLRGLVEEPDIALVAIATPVVIGTLLPAVEDRFVLALVVRAAEREGVLRPDHEGRPLATSLAEGRLQRVELRR